MCELHIKWIEIHEAASKKCFFLSFISAKTQRIDSGCILFERSLIAGYFGDIKCKFDSHKAASRQKTAKIVEEIYSTNNAKCLTLFTSSEVQSNYILDDVEGSHSLQF